MEKNKKKDELQSRRQFFKKAAKGALPILGALALIQIPVLSKAQESNVAMGCSVNSCSGGCASSCYRGCSGGCNTGCYGRCKGGCDSCTGSCQGYCISTCRGGCYGSSH